MSETVVDPETGEILTPANELSEPESDPEPEEDPDTEDEPEDADEPAEPQDAAPPQGQTEKSMERQLDQLERETARHDKRVGEIMGDEAAGLVPCELCASGMPQIQGHRWDAPLTERARETLRALLGYSVLGDFEMSKQSSRCPDCNGQGKTRTDSQVAGMELEQCSRCKGAGFVKLGGTPNDVAPPTYPRVVEDVLGGNDLEPTSADPWGRDPAHPDFGVMPNLVAQRHAVQGAA